MAVLVFSPDGKYVAKATLAAAVASADSVNKTIVVTSPITIDDVTVPATIALRCELGGVITVGTGKTLTINGPFSAGLYQCFSGAGSVVFGSGSVSEVYPEWWGAVGNYDIISDEGVDCSDAFNKAVDSLTYIKTNDTARIYQGGNVIQLQAGTYKFSTPWLLGGSDTYTGKPLTVAGRGQAATVLYYSAKDGTDAIPIGASVAQLGSYELRDFTLVGPAKWGNEGHTVSYGAVDTPDPFYWGTGSGIVTQAIGTNGSEYNYWANSKISNVGVTGFGGVGIWLKANLQNSVRDVFARNCGIAGIRIREANIKIDTFSVQQCPIGIELATTSGVSTIASNLTNGAIQSCNDGLVFSGSGSTTASKFDTIWFENNQHTDIHFTGTTSTNFCTFEDLWGSVTVSGAYGIIVESTAALNHPTFINMRLDPTFDGVIDMGVGGTTSFPTYIGWGTRIAAFKSYSGSPNLGQNPTSLNNAWDAQSLTNRYAGQEIYHWDNSGPPTNFPYGISLGAGTLAFNKPTANTSIAASGAWLWRTITGGASPAWEGLFPVFIATPSAANATGTSGMIAVDANYAYFCIAANTWIRVAKSAW